MTPNCDESMVTLKVPAARLAGVTITIEFAVTVVFCGGTRRFPMVTVVTPPKRDKWREENGEEIDRILPQIEPMMRRLGYPLD